MMTDPIADMFTRIRNAHASRKKTVVDARFDDEARHRAS
jgi:ribosomal protein S8